MFVSSFRLVRIVKSRCNLLGSVRYFALPVKSKDASIKLTSAPKFAPNSKLDDNENSSTLRHFYSMIKQRRYLIDSQTEGDSVRYQFSNEFVEFMTSWCSEKISEFEERKVRPVDICEYMARSLHSIKLTMKELNGEKRKRKWKTPPSKLLDEISRLYFVGIKKLAEQKSAVTPAPVRVNRILCQYADACCSFDFDPSSSFPELWRLWYEMARIFLEEIDSEEKWQSQSAKRSGEFNHAYTYLLSLIIDVALSFHLPHEFSGIQVAWESRLAQFLATFNDRNEYILSLRMARLAQRDGIVFKNVVAEKLAKSGSQRSFAEYKHRIGFGEQPIRSRHDQLEKNLNG